VSPRFRIHRGYGDDQRGTILQTRAQAGRLDAANRVRQGFGAELAANEFDPRLAQMQRQAAENYHVGAEQIAEIGDDFSDRAGVDVDDLGGVGVAALPEIA
jgi:hypothetical protein